MKPISCVGDSPVKTKSLAMLDVVITSTLRPALLDLTLLSFYENLLFQCNQIRLIINIDPVGEDVDSQDVLSICKKYCENVTVRTPEKPSFSAAVKWCWEQVETDFFIHLEDDWLLRRPVNMNQLVNLFEKNEKTAAVRFNLRRNPHNNPPRSDGLSLNPSFFRKTFILEALKHFDTSKDPEKQFRGHPVALQWEFHYYGSPYEAAYVIDTGKKWRKLKSFDKWGKDDAIVTWRGSSRRSSIANLYYTCKYLIFMKYWRWLATSYGKSRLL